MQNTCALILPGYCSFQNILKNPIISQIEAFSYIFFYYSSTITINSTTATPNCTLQSVLFTSRGYTRLGITSLKSVKLNGKKKIEIVCSFNGIPITYRLEMDFFFAQIRSNPGNRCVSCLRNAIRSKTPLSRDT